MPQESAAGNMLNLAVVLSTKFSTHGTRVVYTCKCVNSLTRTAIFFDAYYSHDYSCRSTIRVVCFHACIRIFTYMHIHGPSTKFSIICCFTTSTVVPRVMHMVMHSWKLSHILKNSFRGI